MKPEKNTKKQSCCKSNRLFGALGSASGGGAFAGVHSVCHALCVSLASFLAVFGIIISDTALMFLQDYNIYFWLMGMFFLLVSLVLMILEKPISRKLAVFNTGLLVASMPFFNETSLWIIGWSIALAVIVTYAQEKGVITWVKKLY